MEETPVKVKDCEMEIRRNLIPTFMYNAEHDFNTPEKCCVCLCPLESVYDNSDPDEIVVETRCKHLFHENCLIEVKNRKPTSPSCPLCRFKLTPIQRLQSEKPNDHLIDNSRAAIVDAAVRSRNAVR